MGTNFVKKKSRSYKKWRQCQNIKYIFTHLDVEQSRNCRYDYIEIGTRKKFEMVPCKVYRLNTSELTFRK